MAIQKVGIVGAGTMGNGIAQAFSMAGIDVVMTDIAEAPVQRGLATITGGLDRLLKKEKISAEQKAAVLARIVTSTDTAAVGDCDLVVEAATENESLKLKIFAQLDAVAKPGAILASNTSSLSITKLAAATKRPQQVIGLHFFNPVPMMALVEIISGLQTSAETQAAIDEVARRIGKTPVKVRNSPGFVVNRMLCPMINEAVYALHEGVGSVTSIDTAMRLGANHPMGPLELADFIGGAKKSLDTAIYDFRLKDPAVEKRVAAINSRIDLTYVRI